MKNYNMKKKITITLLSITAVCLAIGLIYYVGTMKSKPPVNDTPPVVNQEQDITVPKIDIPEKENKENPPTTTDTPKKNDVPLTGGVIETNPVKPSEDKPRTKDEATKPNDSTPPKINDKGEEETKVVEPNKSNNPSAANTPKDGDRNANGDIYIEGFGWIPYSGENEVIDAPNAGTGNLIGY